MAVVGFVSEHLHFNQEPLGVGSVGFGVKCWEEIYTDMGSQQKGYTLIFHGTFNIIAVCSPS